MEEYPEPTWNIPEHPTIFEHLWQSWSIPNDLGPSCTFSGSLGPSWTIPVPSLTFLDGSGEDTHRLSTISVLHPISKSYKLKNPQ